MTDQNEEKFTDPKEVLKQIAVSTKPFQKTRTVSLLTEIICYLLFAAFVLVAIYLPGYLETKLDVVEEEIGFYTLDPEERKQWKLLLQLGLGIVSLFPLVTGILFRRVAKRNAVLREIHSITSFTK